MSLVKRVRVSSRALGPIVAVAVKVYPTVAALRQAATRYNGGDVSTAVGVTQLRHPVEPHPPVVTVRLAATHLGTTFISHEVHHAATALYGWHYRDTTTPISDHLTHFNEPFAYLYSDLLSRLVNRLYALGFYRDPESSGQ